MADREITPSACRHCGIPQREHYQQWKQPIGWHRWQAPTDSQVFARMRLRRAFRFQLLDAAGAPFIDGEQYRDRYGDTWRAHGGDEFLFVAWVDGRTVESEAARRGPNDPPLIAHFEDARSVVRSSGPMTLIPRVLEDQ